MIIFRQSNYFFGFLVLLSQSFEQWINLYGKKKKFICFANDINMAVNIETSVVEFSKTG